MPSTLCVCVYIHTHLYIYTFIHIYHIQNRFCVYFRDEEPTLRKVIRSKIQNR